MKKTGSFSGPVFSLTFLSLWIVNGIIILLANRIFPHQVVLGTAHISLIWSLIHVPSSLALIQVLTLPLFHLWAQKKRLALTAKHWSTIYFVINFVSLWGIGRFADQLGMGLASWRVALVLAFFVNLAQNRLMIRLEKN